MAENQISMSDLISELTAIMSYVGNAMVSGVDRIEHILGSDGEHSVHLLRVGEELPAQAETPDQAPQEPAPEEQQQEQEGMPPSSEVTAEPSEVATDDGGESH